MAITMAPQLGWALVAIAMLPAALYGRAVINADGSAVAAAIMVTALWLRGLASAHVHMPGRQAFWLMLCALTKPMNVTFVLLELSALLNRARRWPLFALTVLPAITLAMLWSWRSGADTAAWRMVELTGEQAATFDPVARLSLLLEQPLHFPIALMRAVGDMNPGELWWQLIGVLGLFDTVLPGWAYPAITGLALATFFTHLPPMHAGRLSVLLVAAITLLAYVLSVYLICYLTFTPLDAQTVWGVQGRYFIPVLPLAAIMVAAIFNSAPREGFSAVLAIGAALLSGIASIEAILLADWKS
jgi:uncharacterized membrane protein